MGQEYPNEAPPEYSVVDPQPQPLGSRWWSRKRVWMPVLLSIILVLFGVIFGSVYGVQKSRAEDAERERDRLLANQGWNSSSLTSWYYYPTSTHSYSWSTSTPPAFSTSTFSSSYPYPTPGPSEPSGPILEAQGKVPRDISVAARAPELLIWDLRAGGRLWRKGLDGSWEAYSDRQFLVAPVSVSTTDTTQTAVSVDAVSGRIVYMQFHDGQWDDWQELEFAAQFLRRPAVISRAQDRVDVINVDNEGHVWIVSYDGSAWSEWTELGADITSDVAATTWGEDRIDVFAKNGESVLHKYWSADSGWAETWEDLGNPFSDYYSEPGDYSSSPLVVSWHNGEEGIIDVFINRHSSSHKLFQSGAWSDWLVVYASHEGYEFPDTQSLVKGRGESTYPYAYLISRGTDNCIHYNEHNGTGWGFWSYLWCNDKVIGNELFYPTQFLPTSMIALESGNVELIVRDLVGDVLSLLLYPPIDSNRMWSNDDWTNLGQPT